MSPTNAQLQSLAATILQASTEAALNQLTGHLSAVLLPLAQRWVGQAPDLRHFGDAEDLVHGFLYQLLAPRQRDQTTKLVVLLQPIASGEKELAPRVKRSFVNYLYSLLRKRRLTQSAMPLGSGVGEINPESHPDHWQLITERVREQIVAIREAKPALGIDVPLHAVMLLDERLRLARALAESFVLEDGSTIGNVTIAELAEAVTDWSAEAEQPLPTRSRTLAQVWQEICLAGCRWNIHGRVARPAICAGLEETRRNHRGATASACDGQAGTGRSASSPQPVPERHRRTSSRTCRPYDPIGRY